eukprot:CAMPEP_0175419460 /NCGR_PEP_ID=MMETSP0095-20121207/46241_1 /TAXON_ID=311494 /ORGANISM="Alexandrium monilatum, Strain CCMP3105" /LENGTH=147 /DNA_ID=CAMNT_0016718653 /DNA_START=236 /DNA_END=677 /DNA_ORIENTATION=-
MQKLADIRVAQAPILALGAVAHAAADPILGAPSTAKADHGARHGASKPHRRLPAPLALETKSGLPGALKRLLESRSSEKLWAQYWAVAEAESCEDQDLKGGEARPEARQAGGPAGSETMCWTHPTRATPPALQGYWPSGLQTELRIG